MKTCLCIIRIFLSCKIENFQHFFFFFFFTFFLNFAQNIDCGYTLEPPRRGGSNEYLFMFWSKNKKNRYTPPYPSSAIQRWGLSGVHITQTCFAEALGVLVGLLRFPDLLFLHYLAGNSIELGSRKK